MASGAHSHGRELVCGTFLGALVAILAGCSDETTPAVQGSTGASDAGGAPGVGGRGGVSGTSDASATGGGGSATAGASGADSGTVGIGGSSAAGGDSGSSGLGGSSADAGSAGSPGDAGEFGVHDPNNPPGVLSLSGSIDYIHDPAVIQAGSAYYLFHTGRGISVKRATLLTSWTNAGSVFSSNPSWIGSRVPGVTDLWAPDISFFNATYHLYYSASTFNSNRSCIGHATRASLETGSWVDRGEVICSNVGTTNNWNAIDPNVVIDEAGTPWMSFGSFWSGIKLIRLTPDGARADTTVLSIAGRPQNGGAIEAPFIVRRGAYYYLFVSFDSCCQAENSTYKIAVGRATQVQGPYTDKANTAMTSGGGTILLRGSEGNPSDNIPWAAVGHNAVLVSGNEAFNVYHAYAEAPSDPDFSLRIAGLVWDRDGWPISGGP